MSKIPSIALIPSGYKATEIYSQLPVDGSADLIFDRGTSTEQTRVNSNGLIEDVAVDVPRLDYLDGGCPSLLLEPATTNLITYSEDFTDASWSRLPLNITANSAIAPDGTLTATRLYSSVDGNLFQATAVTTGTFTISFYVKSNGAGADNFLLRLGNFTSTTLTATNEWVRYEFTYTNSGSNVAGIRNVIGQSIDILIWGAQLEQKSYATSYVPSLGTSGVRAAETASKTGLSSYINSTEGVLYAEISALANSGSLRMINLGNGIIERGLVLRYSTIDNNIQMTFFDDIGGLSCIFTYELVSATDFIKVACKYKENDFALYVNGLLVGTEPSGSTFTSGSLNKLSFDNGVGSSPFYGKTKELRVYKEALSDLELATLTGFTSFAEMRSYLNYTAE